MSSTTLLVLSLEAWDDVWRRNQYLFDGLLRTDDQLTVVFVEPSRDLLHDSLHLRVPARGRGLRQAAGYEGRLFLYQPTKWLPRILGPFADLFMRAALHRNLCRAGLRPDLMWLNDPGWYGIVERASLPTIYDITDDWLAAARTRREHRRIVRADASLLKSCTSVVVCSEALRKSRRHARDDIILIPNAVDVARYQTPAERPDDFPDRDIALYVGTLHEDRLDVDLVARTGSTLAAIGSACVLLGPNALSASNTSILANTPGVILLGPRSWDTVPGYLQHAAALIVPHIVSPFTDSLDPLKLYEYLAVGRPIVSTPVAGFRDGKPDDYLDVAPRDTFPDTVARCIARHSPDRSNPDVPDWSDRVRAVARVLARSFQHTDLMNDALPETRRIDRWEFSS
ncbi:Glycosyltransferase involved in cell wall bisynthesis [Paramicrobacterium humi]|uniref:Glycosyltransferase involved in cell wall bisynthesis n=1 Tax=Paramicrobacterium humi TaxID=640635 RepID=A0A1H4MKC1_9MICO|nr:glycosyltransferase [Microbacterium humi]SEB83413.1 Glycosyltransferase involved in cell wall bisynthesis [Microbacterium humi]